ncbi:hypothetical protein LOTGIDRAFT_169138 [Lottia gigantea]|uniref:Peroxidase n=1 Tax=Lottia gigantea TaxID=225164 RepID=V3ZHI3_LOTGI|nr:hypothetical protein LOTGIDRAFT_169138 [Lottia gigantea]ESO83662.1 hypothetical protein LOTGIDRAFT_169138 [Lottia gigantea]
METTAGGAFLPRGRDSDCILINSPYCFDAGDERVHVFPGLTALHTLFVRFHNYIADEFKFSTNWDDETIFQETRKIIAAFMQKITYKDFLPEVLNSATRGRFGLDGPYRYDIHTDPSIANSFATAAYRFGHSLIPDFFIINGTKVQTRKLFNDPQYIFNSFDQVVDNILTNQAEVLDRFLTLEITDHLFEFGDISFDLASFNIQRGRDHGLPPYNDFREWCGLPRVRSFYSSIFGRLGPSMSRLYNHVDELDLFTGAMSERDEPGSAVGPVLSCLLGQQFHDLKHGDSFWYETQEQRRGFTSDQLAAIQKTSFASILCNQFDRQYIQTNPFRVVSNSNPLVECQSLPHFDMSPWLPNRK